MPRSRSGHTRAAAARHRTREAGPVIDGLSARAGSEVSRLERTRNYLRPGDISAAVRRWKEYVHRPRRRLWQDYEQGNTEWECCGDPLEARILLDTVLQALTPRSARELREIISRADAAWNRSAPPYERDD